MQLTHGCMVDRLSFLSKQKLTLILTTLSKSNLLALPPYHPLYLLMVATLLDCKLHWLQTLLSILL